MTHPVLRRPAHRIASSITAREGRLSAAPVIAALLILAACADPTEPAGARLITRVRPAAIKIGVGGGFDNAGNVGDIPNTQWHPFDWRFLPAFGDFASNQVANCTLYGRCNAGTLASSLGTLGLAPNADPNPDPNGDPSPAFGYMTTTSFVESGQTIAVRASAIESNQSLQSSTTLTGKGRYQLNFDYAFLTNTQAPSAGANPFAEFQLLWDQNPSAPQLPYERSDEIFRISRSDLLANPSLQQAGGCGQGGIGNAVYSLCTGWRNKTVDIPDFYNGQRFVLRLLLQDGGATFSDTDPVTRLIPDNAYASVLAMDNFKLVGLPVITGSTQTPDGPLAINTPFSLLVTYDYADPAATHTAAINWTDGTPGETPTTTQANGSGSFPSSSHSFTAAGLYMVLATVTDNSNNVATGEIPVAVYDPSVGFATGAGWFISPPGAYVADPSLTDKAHFAFVSKIDKKTAGLVTGSANFRFQAADLNFDGTSYDWLRVAGPTALMKGSGTVNDVPGFGFLISAVDGQINGGGGIDKFRIKIWNKSTSAIVYDNQVGADENAAPTTTLGGGSIAIKK